MSEPAPISQRMAGIRSFHVMELLARAQELQAQGRDIVHMEVGEPDFPTPPAVLAAARRALDDGHTGYSPALGIPALREAISRFYSDRFGVHVAPERIAVTPGASGALLLALGVTLDPGRKVLMADPGYPCNRHFVRTYDGQPVEIPTGAESGYQLNVDNVEPYWGPDVAAVMVATPSNPTGTTLESDALQRLAQSCESRRSWLIVDEIYGALNYEADPETVLSRTDSALVVNSFSKYFCMTGWRLGWLVMPESLVNAVDRLAQNLFLCPPRVSQHAALAAFQPDTLELLERQRHEFGKRRDFLLPALRELGFNIPVTPTGAFYIYADCSALTGDSYRFCWDLLERAGVAITPGVDFGENQAQRHVRFAYTAGLDRLQSGIDKIRRFLADGA